MANKQNLTHVLTASEQRKGGKASALARKKRKTLCEELLLLLAQGDTQQRLSTALIERALLGDTKAFEVIRDTIGEKPVDKVEVATIDPDVVAEVEAMVRED